MPDRNPFPPADADRHAIWEVLVRRDSEFFLGDDWRQVAGDYVAEGFLGIDAGGSADSAQWRIGFPRLDDYREAAIASRFDASDFAEDLRAAWFRCQSLTTIEITGELALAHKRIAGSIARRDGGALELGWRSIFMLRRLHNAWKITGFIGYLPL
jgi:hypothetical protein